MTLEDIKKVAMPACREFKVKRLDLFGSLARGEATAESDIDLLVLIKKNVPLSRPRALRLLPLTKQLFELGPDRRRRP